MHSQEDMTDQWPNRYGVEVQQLEEEQPVEAVVDAAESGVEDKVANFISAQGLIPIYDDKDVVVGYNQPKAAEKA